MKVFGPENSMASILDGNISATETPVNELCMACTDIIKEGDSGYVIPFVDQQYKGQITIEFRPYHLVCAAMYFRTPAEIMGDDE